MAYLYNIPQATDQISLSQGQILGNFTALGVIGGNATAGSSMLDATIGFKWIQLTLQAAIPPAGSGFIAGNIGLYTALSPNSGRNELYINLSTGAQVPATAAIVSAAGPGFNGWTYLPSGVKMVWGYSTTPGTATPVTTTYTAVAGFPGFSTYATPFVTRYTTQAPVQSDFIYVQAYSTVSFDARSSNNGLSKEFTWFAIGI